MPLTRFPAFKVVRMFRLLIHRAEHVGKVHQSETAAGWAAHAFLIRDAIAGDADNSLVYRDNAHHSALHRTQASHAVAAMTSSITSAQKHPMNMRGGPISTRDTRGISFFTAHL